MKSEGFWLIGMPIPPSINHAYVNSKWGGRFKSQEMVLWERDFQAWTLTCRDHIRWVYESLNLEPSKFTRYALDCNFYFLKSRLLCKNGKTKKLDVDNRLKATFDAVSSLLQFDDSLIYEGTFMKTITEATEHCDVRVRILMPEGMTNET